MHMWPKLTSGEKAKINLQNVTRCVTRCKKLREEPLRNEIWSIYNDEYFEILTFYSWNQ